MTFAVTLLIYTDQVFLPSNSQRRRARLRTWKLSFGRPLPMAWAAKCRRRLSNRLYRPDNSLDDRESKFTVMSLEFHGNYNYEEGVRYANYNSLNAYHPFRSFNLSLNIPIMVLGSCGSSSPCTPQLIPLLTRYTS